MNFEFQHFIETNKINGRYFLKKKYLLHNILCKIAHPYRIWDWVEHILFCCFHVFIVFSNFCVFHNTRPKDLYTIKNIVIYKNRKVKGKTTTKKFPQTKKLFPKKGGK